MTTALFETEVGNINIQFFSNDAPNTVNNFTKLISDGFYDGLAFHRVIPGFMAQGGCPNTREGASGMPGTGGPGYQFQDELSDVPFEQGIVGMANAGPNTNGSQFYLMLDAAPHLTNRYTAFGRVTSGLEHVLAITPRDPMSANEPGDEIISIEVIEG